MSTRNVPPWYGVSDGPVFKRYSELKQELVRRENECVHTKAWWYKETTFPAVSWERFAHISNTLKERAKREREMMIFVPVMVPRMCANESPTSSTDTPEALSEAISRSSFDKRLVSM